MKSAQEWTKELMLMSNASAKFVPLVTPEQIRRFVERVQNDALAAAYTASQIERGLLDSITPTERRLRYECAVLTAIAGSRSDVQHVPDRVRAIVDRMMTVNPHPGRSRVEMPPPTAPNEESQT